MRTHDHEPEAPVAAREPVVRREPDTDAADAAQRAAAEGRAARLAPESVLHLQRTAGNAGVNALLGDEQLVTSVPGSGGQPLEPATRQRMEERLGADLSSVRVHTGSEAAAAARSVQAHAYTVGEDVVFGEGQYQPGTAAGERMLAHELTHVLQQRSGPVDGTDTGAGYRVSDPDDRFERAAEAVADRVVNAGAGDVAAPGAAAGVQRQAAEEEEPEEAVQGALVQRAGAEEEEEELEA